VPRRSDRPATDTSGGRQSWPLEQRYSHFLAYALRALPRVLVLAAAWATMITIVGGVMKNGWDLSEVLARAGVLLPALAVLFMLFGYTMALLEVTLAAAWVGKAGSVAWPGFDLAATVRGGFRGLLAFLAGPVVPALGLCLLLFSAEPQGLDWLVLWGLGIVAVAYWALAVLAVLQTDSLRDLHPRSVLRVTRQLGFRAPLTAVLIALAVVGPALQTLRYLERPQFGVGVWLLLVLSWTGQTSWTVLCLRWFGVRRFQTSRYIVTPLPGHAASADAV
jgi:hypothetical protein